MPDILLVHPDLSCTKLSIPEERIGANLYFVDKRYGRTRTQVEVHFDEQKAKDANIPAMPIHTYEPVVLHSGGTYGKYYRIYLRKED